MKCTNCQSAFFKTLEARMASETVLLYKKRCKRCKYKYLFRKTLPEGTVSLGSYEEWATARKLETAPGRQAERGRVFVSEYTGRISHAAEEQLPYLNRIKHAKGIRYEWQKATHPQING